MKKTYTAPSAERVALETEEILDISFTGAGTVLDDKKPENPASDFGNVSLF